MTASPDKRGEELVLLMRDLEDRKGHSEWLIKHWPTVVHALREREKSDQKLLKAMEFGAQSVRSHAGQNCTFCGKPYSEPSGAPTHLRGCRDDHTAPSTTPQKTEPWTDEAKARLNLALFGKADEPLAWIRADGLLIGSKEEAKQQPGYKVYPLYALPTGQAPFAASATRRNEIIEECAKVAMDLPLASGEERHDYRWTSTGKAMALDTASAIRALKT